MLIWNFLQRTIIVPHEFTASDEEEEEKLAYFREDFALNQHHWTWHLVYPNEGPMYIMESRSRRGELFYYMHHQVLARWAQNHLSLLTHQHYYTSIDVNWYNLRVTEFILPKENCCWKNYLVMAWHALRVLIAIALVTGRVILYNTLCVTDEVLTETVRNMVCCKGHFMVLGV